MNGFIMMTWRSKSRNLHTSAVGKVSLEMSLIFVSLICLWFSLPPALLMAHPSRNCFFSTNAFINIPPIGVCLVFILQNLEVTGRINAVNGASNITVKGEALVGKSPTTGPLCQCTLCCLVYWF